MLRALGTAAFSFLMLAAQADQPRPAGDVNRSVALDVVVTDKSGEPISGLRRQDFTLLDNKRPQQITSFRAVESGAKADEPVEVILLMDEVNTSFENVSLARQQVERFFKRNGGELARPVSMVFLSDAGAKIESGSSRDGNVLIGAMKQEKPGLRVVGRAQGIYGADDRLTLSLRAVEQLIAYESTRSGRKLLVWISPGWPLLSGPRVELSSKDQQRIFNSIVEMSDGLRKARITLYAVDPLGTSDTIGLRTSYYEQFLKGVKAPKQVEIGNLGLQVLAFQSGGRVFNSSNDVAGEIAKCVDDTNAFYALTFDGLAGDGPNEYHALQVKVDKPGLTARTRSGYYAQPGQSH